MIKKRTMENLLGGGFWSNSFQNTKPILDKTIADNNAQYWTVEMWKSNVVEFPQVKTIEDNMTLQYNNAK